MNFRPCSSCKQPMTARGLLEGRCHHCGALVPDERSNNAGVSPPKETPREVASNFSNSATVSGPSREAAIFPPRLPLRIQWGYFATTLLFIALGALMFYSAASDSKSRVRSTSRRVQAMEKLLGERGSSVLFGVVALGVAALMGSQVLTRKPVPDKPPPPPEARGWWFVPLPLERRPIARAAAMPGLFCSIPLALMFAGGILIVPFAKNPIDMGGLICLGPFAGFMLALAAHFFAALRGFRLSFLGWLISPILFFGVAWGVNALAAAFELRTLKGRIVAAREGEPEFSPDPELKAAFTVLLNRLSKEKTPELYMRFVEKHETELAPKADVELAIWKLDRDFAEFARLKMDIPGSKPACIDLHGGHVMKRISDGLKSIVPERRLKFAYAVNKEPNDNKCFLEIEATSRHDGGFTKFGSSFGRPSLLAKIRIDWKFRLLDRDGTQLYAGEWTTRPTADLTFKDLPLGIDYGPYKLLQLSAYDNFAREFLGRLGLPPGEVKKTWSFKEW